MQNLNHDDIVALLENAPLSLIIHRNGRLLYVNRAFFETMELEWQCQHKRGPPISQFSIQDPTIESFSCILNENFIALPLSIWLVDLCGNPPLTAEPAGRFVGSPSFTLTDHFLEHHRAVHRMSIGGAAGCPQIIGLFRIIEVSLFEIRALILPLR